MKRSYTWFLLLLAAFFCSLFLHELAEHPFEWFVKNYGNIILRNIFNTLAVLIVAAGVYILFRIKKENLRIGRIIPHWLITLILSALAYQWLMPYKSESMHFVQYGLISFLAAGWLKDYWNAFNLAFLLGMIDEAYQYISEKSAYLDWNDFVLNLLGSALGILVFMTVFQKVKKDHPVPFYQAHFCYILVFVLCLGVAFSWMTGIVCEFKGHDCYFTFINAEEGVWSEAFWDRTGWGQYWHRIKPLEGLIITAFMPLIYLPIFRRWEK